MKEISTMSLPLSVITCVYNAEKYIDESLSSLANQTFQDFELVLVNDGSNDGTRKKLIDFYENNSLSTVRLLENQYNVGVPISRNRAILEARGKFVAIHDADDISLPDRFEKQVKMLQEDSDLALVGGHAIKINENGEEIGKMDYPPVAAIEMINFFVSKMINPFIDPSTMFRRDVFIKLGGYSVYDALRYVQDLDLWCRMLLSKMKVTNIEDFLVKYRDNPKGVTKKKQNEMMAATKLLRSHFIRRVAIRSVLNPRQYAGEQFTEYTIHNTENIT